MVKASLVLLAFVAPLVGAAVCGCNQQSNRHPGWSAVGGTAAPLVTPQGPYPRGQVNPANLPQRQGPSITVTSPARGAQLTATHVDVEVEVTDPDGVGSVAIQGAPATDVGGGRWQATVPLAAGLNLIEVEAVDGLGDRSRARFSVVQGQFVPGGTFVDGALLRLDQPALDVAAREIEARTGALDLVTLLPHPVLQTTLVTVDVTAVTHAPPRVTSLTAQAGTMTAVLDLHQVSVDLDVNLLGRGQAIATADRVRGLITATIQRPAGPATGLKLMGFDVDRLDVTFTNLQLRPQSGLAVTVLSPVANLLMFALRGALSSAIEKALMNALSKPMAGADTPMRVNLPTVDGSTAALDLLVRADGGRGWGGAGLDLLASASATAVTPHPHALPADVLVTRPPAPVIAWAPTDHVGLALSADAANAFAHAYWLAGAARYQIDGTKPAKSPPAARLLHPFFPVVRDLAPDPATPLVIDISLEAPPVVRLDRPDGAVGLLVPEAQVSVALDYMDGGPRAEVLRTRLSVELAVDAAVVGNDLVLSNLTCAGVAVDVIAEPSGDLDDQGVEDFILQAIPTLLGSVAQRLPRIPLPGIPAGVTLVAPTVEARDGWLIVRAGVR